MLQEDIRIKRDLILLTSLLHVSFVWWISIGAFAITGSTFRTHAKVSNSWADDEEENWLNVNMDASVVKQTD